MHANEGKPGFHVVVQSPFLSERAFELSTRTFLKFFHSLTPKHHRRVRFVALDASPDRDAKLDALSQQLGQAAPVLYSMQSLQVRDLDALRRQPSVLFHPSTTLNEMTRVELLSQCLPVITFDVWQKAHSFDRASCMYIPTILEEQASREFSRLICDLYHDPGALKVLQDRALSHRRSVGGRIMEEMY